MSFGALVAVLLGTQAADPADPVAAATPDDTVIVTARLRAERAIDVPVAITAVDGATIERFALRDARDLAGVTPGLFVEAVYPSTASIVLRGISTDTADPTSEPRVSVFQDGVYSSRPQSGLFAFYDLERVEVVKGPQSNLFGRSALTGAINIVQHKADPSATYARTAVEVGSRGHLLAQGAANVATSPATAVRLAGYGFRRDGYVDSLGVAADFNGIDTAAVRGAFHAEAPGFAADLIVNGQRDRFTGASLKSGTFFPADARGTALGDLDPDGAALLTTAGDFELGARQGGRRGLGSATLLLRAESGPLTLAATTAASRFTARFVGDYDGTSLPILTSGERSSGHQFSQDLRLSYQADPRLFATLGASVSRERTRQRVPIQLDERYLLALQTGFLDRASPVLLPQAAYVAPPVSAALLSGVARAFGTTLAPALAAGIAANLPAAHRESYERDTRGIYADVYGDVSVRVVDRVNLDLGLRYAHADKRSGFASATADRSILGGVFGALAQPAPVRQALLGALAVPGAGLIPPSARYPLPFFALLAQPTATPGGDRAAHDDGGLSARAAITYSPSADATFYASYARGRRPEILSAEPPVAPGGAARLEVLDAETIDAVELGGKVATADRRLEADASVFTYDYRHFQTELLRGTVLVQTDGGRARVYGGEAQLRFRPVPQASIQASYGYTHARFGSGLYDGNRFRLSPDHQVALFASYALPLAGGTLDIAPKVTWRSRVFFDNTNGDPALFVGAFLLPANYRASQGPVSLTDLRLSYAPPGDRLRIGLFVTNLFDRRYLRDTGSGSLRFGLPTYVAAVPRVAGISLSGRM